MQKLAFIRPELTINLLVADTVEDILPKVTAAAPPSPDCLETRKAAPVVERM